MPLPKPLAKEKENDFIGRCVPLVIESEGLDKDDDKQRKQAVAICYSQWRRAKGGKAMEIEDLKGVVFDVGGEEVTFEELVEAYKAEGGEGEKEWHLTKSDITELIGIIDAELDRRKKKKEKEEGGKSVALEDMTLEELEDRLFNACPSRTGAGGKMLSKPSWIGKVRSWVKSAATKTLTGYRRRLVMVGTKMGMSFKGLAVDDGKALSLDEQARQVRDAWRNEFVKPGVPGEVSGSYWPKEVFEDRVIVETPQGLYAYSYEIGDDGIEFGEPVKVEVEYRPVGEKGLPLASSDEDTVIAFGGEIKALGDGRVGGYVVRFGKEDEKDLTGQWFTPSTYYGLHDGDGADTMVHHGIPLKVELRPLAERLLQPLKAKRDQVGIWAETVLDMADEYERMIHEMVQAGKLHWSSGSVKRLIRVKPDGEITRWPIVEGSLTPIPAEFRGTQVMPLKSYLEAVGLPRGIVSIPQGEAEAPRGGAGAGAPGLEVAIARAKAEELLNLDE